MIQIRGPVHGCQPRSIGREADGFAHVCASRVTEQDGFQIPVAVPQADAHVFARGGDHVSLGGDGHATVGGVQVNW